MSKVLKGVKNEITLQVTANVMDDMGKETPVKFKLTFKRIADRKKVKEVVDSVANGENDDLSVIREYLLGWSGIEFDDGTPVEFNDENLEMVMTDRDYARAIVDGFGKVQLGYKALQAKNS